MFDTPITEQSSHYRMTPIGRIVPPEVRKDIKALLAWAGLDWRVRVEPLSTDKGRTNLCAVVREDTGEVISPRSVTDRYTPFQNADAFGLLGDHIAKGDLIPEIVCDNPSGKGRIWLLCHSKVALDVGGADPVHMYYLLSNSHALDTFSAQALSMRIHCTNFLSHSLIKRDAFVLRHVGDWETRRALLSAGLSGLQQVFQDSVLRMEFYATEQFPVHRAGKPYATYVFPPDAAEEEDGYTKSQRRRRDELVELLCDRDDLFVGEHMHRPLLGTAWAALNAVTYQLTHLSRHRSSFKEREEPARRTRDLASKRFDSLVYGDNRTVAARAMEFLDAYVQNGTYLRPPSTPRKSQTSRYAGMGDVK